MLRSLLLVGNSCVNTSKAWLWILENAPSSVFRFILSTVIIYKQRARRLSLCCANWSRTLSTLIFFSCRCAILVTMEGDRRCFVLASSTSSSNFITQLYASARSDWLIFCEKKWMVHRDGSGQDGLLFRLIMTSLARFILETDHPSRRIIRLV